MTNIGNFAGAFLTPQPLPAVGEEWSGVVTVEHRVTIAARGGEFRPVPEPVIAIPLDAVVASTTDALLGVEVVLGTPTTSSFEALDDAALEAALDELAGLEVDAALTPDGGLVRWDARRDDLGVEDIAAIGRVLEALVHIVAPVPTTSTGVGARWELRSEHLVRGIPAATSTNVALVAIDGDRYTLEVDYRQNVEMDDGEGNSIGGVVEGTGTIVRSTTEPFPLEAEIQGSGLLSVVIDGEAVDMRIEVRHSLIGG